MNGTGALTEDLPRSVVRSGSYRDGLILRRRFGKRIQVLSVGTEYDKEVVSVLVAGQQEGSAAHIGVQRGTRSVRVAGIVLPFFRIARNAIEDLHPHVARVPHEQPSVRNHGDGLGTGELPRPFSFPAQSFDVGTGRIENTDPERLRVEDIDVAVLVHCQ